MTFKVNLNTMARVYSRCARRGVVDRAGGNFCNRRQKRADNCTLICGNLSGKFCKENARLGYTSAEILEALSNACGMKPVIRKLRKCGPQ